MGAQLSTQELSVVTCVCARDKGADSRGASAPSTKPFLDEPPVPTEAVPESEPAAAPAELSQVAPVDKVLRLLAEDKVSQPASNSNYIEYTDGVPVDVHFVTVTKQTSRQSFGLSVNSGNKIGNVSPSGLAVLAGLRKGDVLVSVDGDDTVKGEGALFKRLRKVKAGTSITFGVSRPPTSPGTAPHSLRLFE